MVESSVELARGLAGEGLGEVRHQHSGVHPPPRQVQRIEVDPTDLFAWPFALRQRRAQPSTTSPTD